MPVRPVYSPIRLGVLLLNAWFFLSGLAAFFLYWVLSLSYVEVLDGSLAADIGRLTDVGKLQQLAITLLQAVVESRRHGFTLAVWGLCFVLLSSGLSLLLLFWDMRSPAPTREAGATAARRGFAADLLHGRLPLWQAFWLVYVPVPMLVGIAVLVLIGSLDAKTQVLPSMFAFPLTLGFLWTVFFSATVLVWRCSENTGRPIWGKVARVSLILAVAVPLLRFLIGMLPFLGLLSRT